MCIWGTIKLGRGPQVRGWDSQNLHQGHLKIQDRSPPKSGSGAPKIWGRTTPKSGAEQPQHLGQDSQMWERRRGLAHRPQKSGQGHPKIRSRGCLISRTGAPQNLGQENPKIQGRTPKIRPGRPQKSGQEPLNPWGRGTPKPGRRHVSPSVTPPPAGSTPELGFWGPTLSQLPL